MYALIFSMLMLGMADVPTVATATVGSAPSLEVIGPSGGVPGDIIILAAKSDSASHINWLLVSGPVDKEGNQAKILPLESNLKCLVQSKAGTYVIVCTASNADGNIAKVQTVTITGDGPSPDPDPGVDLNSTYGAVKLTYNHAKGKDLATIKQLASNYEALAAKYKDTTVDIDTILENERVVNRDNPGLAKLGPFDPWATEKVAADVERLKAGRVTTGAQYAVVLAEYAKGFRLAAGGK